jgi:hypothetical protein
MPTLVLIKITPRKEDQHGSDIDRVEIHAIIRFNYNLFSFII